MCTDDINTLIKCAGFFLQDAQTWAICLGAVLLAGAAGLVALRGKK